MFYSYEVLTERKYGVSTIWLVATLGAKSTLKSVGRKEIVEVKIPKACKTIMNPEAPLALRLQSTLLYGVSRVYSQQCSYVLTDAEHAYQNLHKVSNAITASAAIVDRGHVAKRDQITLREDPNFVLDLAFDLGAGFGANDLDLSSVESFNDSGGLSPNSARSSVLGSEHDDPSVAGLIIPSSGNSTHGDPFSFGVGGGSRHTSISAGQGPGHSQGRPRDEELRALLDDPGFGFDDDGNWVNAPAEEHDPAVPSAQTPAAASRGGSVYASTIRGDFHIPDHQEAATGQDQGDDYLPIQDDYDMHQDAEAFPTVEHAPRPPSEEMNIDSPESSVIAPVRRARRRKVLPLDQNLELRNNDLANWSRDYVKNMQDATTAKHNTRSAHLAKANANFWVLGSGLAGIGKVLGPERIPEQLQMFAGDKLLEALIGLKLTTAGEKHAREEEQADDADGEERRVRSRTAETEIGRGDADMAEYADDDDLGPIYGDDTVELGREAGTPLADRNSTLMPWNISASIRGSSARPRTQPPSIGGRYQSSSIGGGPALSPGHRASSIVAPSPLVGRGQPAISTAENDDLDLDNDPGTFFPANDLESGTQGPRSTHGHDEHPTINPRTLNTQEEYEGFGAAAAVDTQTAGTAAWMRSTLDSESMNFLSFVEAAIQEKVAVNKTQEQNGQEQDEDEGDGTTGEKSFVDFATLLPPTQNSAVVAAQGLLHVLSLGTKAMLQVGQGEAFGAITLRLV